MITPNSDTNNEKLETIGELWEDFASSILAAHTPGTPIYDSSRMLFFTGAFALFMQITKLNVDTAHGLEVGAQYMLDTERELRQFMAQEKKKFGM